MGADMYIESINDLAQSKYRPQFDYWVRKRDEYGEAGDKANEEQAQKKVNEAYENMNSPEGYYRDSYNGTNLLWQLGLDYWGYVSGLLDEDGYMQPAQIQQLLNEVLKREVPPPEALKLDGVKIDNDQHSPAGWHQFFTEKRKRLIAFLGNALDRNEPISCSF